MPPMADRSMADLPPCEQAQSRIARRLIEAAGGMAAASAYTGKSEAQLCRYGRPNYAESMPISVIEALEAVTHGTPDHPLITRHLARRAGHALIRLPEVGCKPGEMLKYLGEQAKASGELVDEICSAIANGGAIDAREAIQIRAKLSHQLHIIMMMDAELKLIEESE